MAYFRLAIKRSIENPVSLRLNRHGMTLSLGLALRRGSRGDNDSNAGWAHANYALKP